MESWAREVLRQLLPPFVLGARRAILKRFQVTEHPNDADIRRLKIAFDANNLGIAENELAVRKDIILKLHPDSMEPMKNFCFESPDMVEEMDAFLSLTKNRERLLDIGALHGAFSLIFAAASPRRKIVAVDASPLAFARLLYNVHKNGFTNITPVECALSDGPGVLRMHYEWEHAVAARTEREAILIQKRTGDDLCRELGFAPDTVKIDTEGHEVKVVRGLAETVAQHKPLVFLELHPLLIRKEKEDISDLLRFFTNCEYRIFSTDRKAISPERIFQSTTEITETKPFAMRVIFLPPGGAMPGATDSKEK